ncbi:hypothetical protein [Micromonospora tarensis]|uniref:Uncharacterized protein n=1 Tax=Micromonospora tarensis TaxID=2806100 RepID=A0ABS1Y9S8_9ACTN|nr:hypothetical protein [Micromonospora tarensis]MBM0274144.1 hypothetical protein [Micromonospora tarensis]
MDLATLIPAGGLGAVSVGGTLLAVVVYLLNANRVDRREYQDAVDRAEARADAAEARRATAEARVDGLQQAVDAERAARRTAEDRAAAAERTQQNGGQP